MKRKTTCCILVMMIPFAFLLAGILVPALFLGDGLDRYEGDERVFAQYALNQATFTFDNPFERLARVKLRVVDVHQTGAGPCEIYTPEHPDLLQLPSDYVATVGEYTLFAFPFRFAEFKCIEYYTSPGERK